MHHYTNTAGSGVSGILAADRLQYLYANRAQAGHHDPKASYGQADLVFAGDTGQGRYFNDEKRGTYGTFALQRV